jgi:outer membrane protein TolC
VNAAKARLQQNIYGQEEIRRGIEREIRNLVAELNSSLKRLQLLEKNVAVAEKSFDITRQRFSDGDIDSQALALERERLNNAYTSHLSAYITYQLMQADLMRKTFYDFLRDTPLL